MRLQPQEKFYQHYVVRGGYSTKSCVTRSQNQHEVISFRLQPTTKTKTNKHFQHPNLNEQRDNNPSQRRGAHSGTGHKRRSARPGGNTDPTKSTSHPTSTPTRNSMNISQKINLNVYTPVDMLLLELGWIPFPYYYC